ncbi:hypothetical protein DFH07DRAFT_869155 [Mycena maculata]|uniref:CxC2-like cysteine cluster KDZ transposase-associated domain-containing protein n=1 Tax=Mycena maculata TaxID=230809 RepID=A0AAD7IV92_9AGAR|nr:hypothetical protein DFH07DRAFT_869155 [Mycena maculata]
MLHLEGRGDHADFPLCHACRQVDGDHRCSSCLGGGALFCSGCIVEAHRLLPFHKIEHWTGLLFEPISLKALGLQIQLGHWHGVERICPVPTPATEDDFVIIDVHGVHTVGPDYCGCGRGGPRTVQLFCAGLCAATTTNSKTAATFTVLRQYHLLSFESKCSAWDFYQALARQTDNVHHKRDKDRYHEFLLMTKEWRNCRMLKRSRRAHDPGGIDETEAGACVLLCSACPHPGKNLLPGWENAPDNKQFLYALFLTIDANFRLKRKDVSSKEKDPGLCKGWAFYCEVTKYMTHVKKHWAQKQDVRALQLPLQQRSHCVAHDAVDKPDREARGTASSGVGAVDCTRHNMKRPSAVGDLQLGERYINMDYMFFASIASSDLMRFFVSYDIACKWHIHIWKRLAAYANETLMINGTKKFMTFLAPEQGWANANPLTGHTKEMGPGARRDTLDDHWNDWNWKKIIVLGEKTETAVPEMVKAQEVLVDMENSLLPEVVTEFTEMVLAWEANEENPNPFEMQRKDEHVAKVRVELAKEVATRAAERREKEGEVQGDMHITELIGMGLQLEDQQRVLAFDVAATGLHPADGQRRTMLERTSKLCRKIFAWIELQTKFFPTLQNVRDAEDEARAQAAETQAIPGVTASGIKLEVPVDAEVQMHEYRLRVGQAQELLHDVRRLLLVWIHTYKGKDTHWRGVHENMRSGHKIAALNDQTTRAAAQYCVARKALETLGPLVKRNEWQLTLLELAEDDVRGLPQLRFGDPERQKKRSKKKKAKKMPKVVERPLSWIWINQGEKWEPGDKAVLNEAVQIEWAKTRACAMRWIEEVGLLEEEMCRTVELHCWWACWWRDQVGQKGLLEGPQLEGETAYALRQAALRDTMADECISEWKDLPQLIWRGRAGLMPGQGDREGEEEEPIPGLPWREVRGT